MIKTENTPKVKKKFPGAFRAAREFGVTYPHLYRVLTGERRSPRLEKLWEEWNATQKKTKPKTKKSNP